MRLPEELYFSQISLQDFVDCRKRFYLRHLSRLPWPAIEMEPAMLHEHNARMNARFHQLAHQFLLGIPIERLSATVYDPDLEHSWISFLEFLPSILGQDSRSFFSLYPEINLNASLGERRLFARYDLLVGSPDGSLVIYIWKTLLKRPAREELSRLLQTRVLPYLLVRAGRHFNRNQPVQPSQVELVYWFAAPDKPASNPVERFVYNDASYQTDESFLNGLVETIQRLEAGEFNRTADERRCLYCSYRSLCERGVLAGDPFEPGVEGMAGFDLEHASPLILED